MELDRIIESLKAPLKLNGYKKKNTTWFKTNDEITLIFNIQKSQYDSSLWYYNFGAGINIPESRPISSVSVCHITERLDMKPGGKELTPDILLKAIMNRENKYGNIHELRIRAVEGKLPKTTKRQAEEYLTTVKF